MSKDAQPYIVKVATIRLHLSTALVVMSATHAKMM
eukprot:CAMPEP_0171284818 /NCGR_PEP_ID=MMETSP0790-20130122/68138_1 /TAXON_ID=2925 /ORGANISM="Alexandrium catenella, Strain OF101" /LENGTH=34 /DNA_ID= /DNA_START= /DNA_END= /DNA_ORIENTATION=